jgi:hypothetical protein
MCVSLKLSPSIPEAEEHSKRELKLLTKLNKMKTETKSAIKSYINNNLDEVKASISKALLRDSCYSTIVAWDGENVIAWHGGPENSEKTTDESLTKLWSGQFESVTDDREFLKEEITEYLEGKTASLMDFDFTFIDKDTLNLIIEAGIKSIAKKQSKEMPNYSDTRIVDAVQDLIDERNRPEFVEQIIESIIDELN